MDGAVGIDRGVGRMKEGLRVGRGWDGRVGGNWDRGCARERNGRRERERE